MTDLVTDVPAVAVLEGDRIVQIREEGAEPRDVAWTVTHKGGPGCGQHPDITGLHIGWESADGDTGVYEFKEPATTWLTVAYAPAVSDGAPGEADETVAEIVDRVTLGISPADPEYVVLEAVAEDAAGLSGLTPRPIPGPGRHAAETEQVSA